MADQHVGQVIRGGGQMGLALIQPEPQREEDLIAAVELEGLRRVSLDRLRNTNRDRLAEQVRALLNTQVRPVVVEDIDQRDLDRLAPVKRRLREQVEGLRRESARAAWSLP